MSARLQRRSAILPAIVLIAVAVVQIALTRTVYLSPWKGGGFGMFSTTDDAGKRHVRIVVEATDRSEEIEIAPSLADAADRAAVLPTDREMSRLARLVVARERRNGRPVETVRIQCFRVTYAPDTLAATTQLLRQFTYPATAR
jgi:hypothetical protein